MVITNENEIRCEKLQRGLRVERRESGTSVTGPHFRVWEEDHRQAVSWAQQLSRPARGEALCAFVGQSRTSQEMERIRHILLAEDDRDLRVLLAQGFRERGYCVTECVDGSDLVSKLGSFLLFGPPTGFDLVVSDIRMPGATALEILEAMRNCKGMPPVILTTAFPSAGTRADARRLGVAAIFEKPFEIRELIEKAEELLEGPGGAS